MARPYTPSRTNGGISEDKNCANVTSSHTGDMSPASPSPYEVPTEIPNEEFSEKSGMANRSLKS